MARKIITEPVARQLGIILSDIAMNAEAIRQIAVMCVAQDRDQDLMASLHVAIGSLAERIGWAADVGVLSIDGSAGMVGGADAWMMPPAYHHAGAEKKVSHV
jgi:hypothetical protein